MLCTGPRQKRFILQRREVLARMVTSNGDN